MGKIKKRKIKKCKHDWQTVNYKLVKGYDAFVKLRTIKQLLNQAETYGEVTISYGGAYYHIKKL